MLLREEAQEAHLLKEAQDEGTDADVRSTRVADHKASVECKMQVTGYNSQAHCWSRRCWTSGSTTRRSSCLRRISFWRRLPTSQTGCALRRALCRMLYTSPADCALKSSQVSSIDSRTASPVQALYTARAVCVTYVRYLTLHAVYFRCVVCRTGTAKATTRVLLYFVLRA